MIYSKIIKRYRVAIPDKKSLQLHRNARPELYDNSIISSIRENLPLAELSRYPDIDSFLLKLSKFININPDSVFLTSGIDGAIRTIFETFLDSSSKIAILTPTYKMYEVYAEAYEIDLIKIATKKDLSIDINDILCAIPYIKVVFIPNPHEPVENVFSREQILEIVKYAETYGVLVVVDEAYFMFGAPTVLNIAPLNSNLLVMRSFSKGFGLPSIRLGYIVGNKELISRISSRRMAYETNSLSIWIAEWALNNFSLFEEYIREVITTRDFMKNDLSNNGFKVYGSYSNTILIDIGYPDQALKVHKKLKDRNILIRELTEFKNINTWISVGVGKKSSAIKFLENFYLAVK